MSWRLGRLLFSQIEEAAKTGIMLDTVAVRWLAVPIGESPSRAGAWLEACFSGTDGDRDREVGPVELVDDRLGARGSQDRFGASE